MVTSLFTRHHCNFVLEKVEVALLGFGVGLCICDSSRLSYDLPFEKSSDKSAVVRTEAPVFILAVFKYVP